MQGHVVDYIVVQPETYTIIAKALGRWSEDELVRRIGVEMEANGAVPTGYRTSREGSWRETRNAMPITPPAQRWEDGVVVESRQDYWRGVN